MRRLLDNDLDLCIITHGSSRGGKRRGDPIKYYWIMRLLRFARNDRLDYAKLSIN